MRNDRFKEAPRTIAIFRALQLGDLLCTVPAFRAIRAAFPRAQITLVGLPWAQEFTARFSHYLDDFIAFPGWPGLPEQEPDLAQIPVFLEEMQRRKLDLALQMQGSGVISNPLVALFGARRTFGYSQAGGFSNQPEYALPYPEGMHEVHTWLRLVQSLGIPAQGQHLEFPIRPEEQAAFLRLRHKTGIEPGGYICLHPGARAADRRWPAEKFALVGDGLSQMGYQVILTGSRAEKELTAAVRRHMRQPALDLAGQTDLGTLAALLQDSRLLVSNDTGVSHLAAALRVPSLVLFSASDPARWRPFNHHLHHIVRGALQADPQDVLAEIGMLMQEEHRHDRQPV